MYMHFIVGVCSQSTDPLKLTQSNLICQVGIILGVGGFGWIGFSFFFFNFIIWWFELTAG